VEVHIDRGDGLVGVMRRRKGWLGGLGDGEERDIV